MPDIFNAKDKQPTVTKTKQVSPIMDKIKTLGQSLSTKSRAGSAFISSPKNLKFETQEPDEKIILLLRRHPLTNIPWILLVIFMALIPPFVFQIFIANILPLRFQIIIMLAWYLLTFAVGFQNFLSWYFNVDVITDERVVSIGFPNILYREISQARLGQIEDITVTVGGFIRSLFDYGNVLVQTAGEIQDIVFDAIPHPADVAEVLNELLDKTHNDKGVSS
jgi:hypothetical protein